MKIGKSRLQQIIREELSRKLKGQTPLREGSGVLVMKSSQLNEIAPVLVFGGAIITDAMIAELLGVAAVVLTTALLADIATELGWDYYASEAEARAAISQALPRPDPNLRLPASSDYRPTSAELANRLALSAQGDVSRLCKPLTGTITIPTTKDLEGSLSTGPLLLNLLAL